MKGIEIETIATWAWPEKDSAVGVYAEHEEQTVDLSVDQDLSAAAYLAMTDAQAKQLIDALQAARDALRQGSKAALVKALKRQVKACKAILRSYPRINPDALDELLKAEGAERAARDALRVGPQP